MSLKEVGEHITHAGHDPHSNFGTHVGITMAVFGVLLAFCAAHAGGESTDLVKTLIAQSNAHAQYHAQDVKHRVAFLALEQLHATALGAGESTVNRDDVLSMAQTVKRYLDESLLAKNWSEAFNPAIEAHVQAQKDYELAQLAAEVAIVLASVALLIRKRVAWLAALLLGVVSVALLVKTDRQTKQIIEHAEERIAETQSVYQEARTHNKTTDSEEKLMASILAWTQTKPNGQE
jgi:hypothetical protein